MKYHLTKSEVAAAVQIADCFHSIWRQGAVRNCCLLNALLSRHFCSLKSTYQCWKGIPALKEQWQGVLTVIFTETLKGGKAVSDVIEPFTVQKTVVPKLRAKGILTPYVESCSNQSLFEEQTCSFPSCWFFPPAVWCTKPDLYVISATAEVKYNSTPS